MSGYELWAPPGCKDEEKAALQFIVATSKRFDLEVADVNCIARSESFNQALEYIDQLRLLNFGIREIDSRQIVEACVASYNKTATLLEFIDCITKAVSQWEMDNGLPAETVWYEHPCSHDCRRTYVWAQDEFRSIVRTIAHNRLTAQNSIGTIRNPAIIPSYLVRGPVNRLLEWIDFEYRNFLGFYPLPTNI